MKMVHFSMAMLVDRSVYVFWNDQRHPTMEMWWCGCLGGDCFEQRRSWESWGTPPMPPLPRKKGISKCLVYTLIFSLTQLNYVQYMMLFVGVPNSSQKSSTCDLHFYMTLGDDLATRILVMAGALLGPLLSLSGMFSHMERCRSIRELFHIAWL